MNPETYKELIIPPHQVNKKALVAIGPMVGLYVLLYAVMWNDHFSWEAIREAIPANPLTLFAVLLGGIFLHEGLHGLTWAIFSKNGFRSIRFGFMLKLLAPYCHCKEPLKTPHYILGGLAPGLALGVAPSVYALISGNMSWLLFGILFTVAAGGDFAMMWLLRNIARNRWIKDHPSQLGCYIYEDPNT